MMRTETRLNKFSLHPKTTEPSKRKSHPMYLYNHYRFAFHAILARYNSDSPMLFFCILIPRIVASSPWRKTTRVLQLRRCREQAPWCSLQRRDLSLCRGKSDNYLRNRMKSVIRYLAALISTLSRDAAAMSRQAAHEIMIAQGTGWWFPTSHAQYVFVMLRAAALLEQ